MKTLNINDLSKLSKEEIEQLNIPRGNAKSSNCVDEMLKALIIHHMNELDKEAQKISFVFGNCGIENDNITLELIKKKNKDKKMRNNKNN